MRPLVVAAVLLILPRFLLAQVESSAAGHARADGKQLWFPVTAADVRQAPTWPQDAENPPLPPREAIAIARRQLSGLVSDPAVWEFEEICLSRFSEDRWAYFVRFRREYGPNVAVTGGDYFHIPVLMNGTTVEPKITDVGPHRIEPAK